MFGAGFTRPSPGGGQQRSIRYEKDHGRAGRRRARGGAGGCHHAGRRCGHRLFAGRAQHHPVGAEGVRPDPARRDGAGADVQRPDPAVRPRHQRRPVLRLQVRAVRSWATRAPARSSRSRSRASPSCATASTSRTSPPPPMRAACGRPAGSPPRTAGSCSRRRATTRGWPRIDVPGLTAIGLIENLQNFQPSAQTERVLSRQTQVLEKAGPEGRAVLSDIDEFITGINAYLAINSPTTPHVDPQRRLRAQRAQGPVLRRGRRPGGAGLRVPRRARAPARGRQGLQRLQRPAPEHATPGSPTTVDGTFNYDHTPTKPGAPGSVVLDPGSFHATPAVSAAQAAKFGRIEPRPHASNELMVEGKYSTTGHPLLVGGPQVGYFYPGLTYEIDMHAPGLDWRGATSAPFPGYMLIGRGPDFATTLTSASGDVVDEYAETLCGHSATKYLFKGKCRSMQPFDAGTLDGKEVAFKTTVHGPVVGYARVHGRLVAISSKRSSYGKDVLDLLFNRRLSDGQVAQPAVVLQGRRADAADVQLVLHRRQARRRDHDRAAADPAQGHRSEPADDRHRQVGVARRCARQRAPAGDRPAAHAGQGDDDQLEQRRRRTASARPTTRGTPTAPRRASTCSTTTWRGCARTASGPWPPSPRR